MSDFGLSISEVCIAKWDLKSTYFGTLFWTHFGTYFRPIFSTLGVHIPSYPRLTSPAPLQIWTQIWDPISTPELTHFEVPKAGI